MENKKKLFNFHRQFSKPNIMIGNSSVVYTVTMFNRALKIDKNSEILSQNKKKTKIIIYTANRTD